MIKDLKIEKFIEELASSSPTPGGGAAAALVGAISAGLCEMVANLTVCKERYRYNEPEIIKLQKEVVFFKKRLMTLADEDVKAFNKVMAAYKISKEEKDRNSQIENALKGATEVPLETARICSRLMGIARRLAKIGNKNATSDVKSAFFLAKAAKLSAVENIKINLRSVNDEVWKMNIESKIAELARMW